MWSLTFALTTLVVISEEALPFANTVFPRVPPRACGHILGSCPPREAVSGHFVQGLPGSQGSRSWMWWAESVRSLLLRSAGPWHLSHTSCLLCLQTVPTSQRLERALENLHRAVLWRPARWAPGECLVRALDLAMCSGLHALSCRVSQGQFEPPTEHLAYLLLLVLKLSYLLYNSC